MLLHFAHDGLHATDGLADGFREDPTRADDASYILRCLNSWVTIGTGVTCWDIVKALLPWSDVLEPIGDINMRPWLDAIGCPMTTAQGEFIKAFSHIRLQWLADFDAKPDYEEDERNPLCLSSKPLITDVVEFNARWHPCLVRIEPDGDGFTDYSLAACPAPAMAWLPVIIEPIGQIRDQTPFCDGIFLTAGTGGILSSTVTPYVMAQDARMRVAHVTPPHPILMDTILLGLLRELRKP